MIGVLVLSHGALAQALVATALGLLGPQRDLLALALADNEAPEAYAARLDLVLAAQSTPNLVLCDLRGGTPHRLAAERAAARCAGRLAVVSGVNLGMLCEALLLRESVADVDALAHRLVRVGVEQIAFSGGPDVVAR